MSTSAETNVGRIHIIANKVTDANREELVKLAGDLKLNIIGMLPLKPNSGTETAKTMSEKNRIPLPV